MEGVSSRGVGVAAMIGRKAALDWARVNVPKSAPDLKPLYEAYREWMGH